MFKIIKKGSGNFWHNFNNGSKEVNLSDWEIVLDSVNQTVSLQMLNGANVPNNSVIISDVVVIDETDSSIEETFGGVSALRTRLIELNYTPYIVLNGFVPEAPIDGLTYGRKDAEWVEVSGGGSVGTLQQVTDNGNTTTNDITAGGFLSLGNANIPGINFNDAEDLDTSLGFLGADPSITTPRNWVLPDTSGTIALASNIPTVITPETGIYYFNDFLGEFKSSTNDGNIIGDGNFGQTTTAPNSDTNKQGFANVNTTTASAGAGDIYIGHPATGGANFILGGGITSYETLIWLPILSTPGERFSCLIGFSSGVLNQNNSQNNIAFLYDEGNIAFAGAGGASANWRAVTTDTGTRTFTDTGVAVNAGAFIKLKIVVNANASSVEFFIDNTLVATHTTNIPSGNTKRVSVRNYIQKSVGSTQRLLILDYVKLQQTFTTAR